MDNHKLIARKHIGLAAVIVSQMLPK